MLAGAKSINIAGCDEAGRGSFAGPLVAASVILNSSSQVVYQDSKILSGKQRQILSMQIMKEHLCAVGIATVQEIDLLGAQLANQLAIIRSVNNLAIRAGVVLVDGNLKFSDPRYFSIIKGDRSVNVISAASIVAKVYRDNIMSQLHQQFPQYDWQQNKGYGTSQHRNKIAEIGISQHHRKSFIKF
jgi:ribonuclease HII